MHIKFSFRNFGSSINFKFHQTRQNILLYIIKNTTDLSKIELMNPQY